MQQSEEITRQLEILPGKIIEQAKLNSTVYKTLAIPNNLTSKEVHEILTIEIPLRKMKPQKQYVQCKSSYSRQNSHS